MVRGDRSLSLVALTYVVLVASMLAFTLFLAARTPGQPPQVRSGVANAHLLRAQRSWESGHHFRALREYARAYRVVAESTIRLFVGDVLFDRANFHVTMGDYQLAFETCLKAANVMGIYESEIGISAQCPGMRTKALLAVE